MFTYQLRQDIHLQLLETRHALTVLEVIEANRAYLGRFLPWVSSTHDENDVRSFIQVELKRFSENKGFSCGIFYNNQYAGNIGVHDINWDSRYTSIGYWLSEEHQGKGIMTDACRAMINYLFNELGLNKIEIRARTDNPKSQAIPIRLGFQKEGTLRAIEFNDGQYHDHVVYGLLRTDWRTSHA
ncbi:GNAT family N-acetyltransferase [Paenibacillus sp. GCM10023252]|uniref:GNAT family N-acetyltransferase n=1 Tax=Paenibacillus sp. GCM10023252 TaxID=3252649 RepID=UPI003623783B